MTRRSRLGAFLKIAVSAVLLTILWKRYGADPQFRATIAELELSTLLLAEIVLVGGLVLSALRWKILLGAAGVSLGFGRSLRLYLSGYFFNFFLPTTVGGDVIRVLGVGQGTPLPVVTGSILVERFLGFACLLGLGIVASFAVESLAVARAALLVAGGAFAVALALLLLVPLPEARGDGTSGRLFGALRRTALEVRAYGFHPVALFAGLLLSLGWQFALVWANGILSEGLGGVAPWKALLALVPVVQALTMIPVSFGGLGLRELGYEYFFEASGFDPAGAVALGASFLVISVALALVGGLVTFVSPVRGVPR